MTLPDPIPRCPTCGHPLSLHRPGRSSLRPVPCAKCPDFECVPPPVPPGWHRDAPARNRDELIASHLDDLVNRHAPSERGAAVLATIEAAWTRAYGDTTEHGEHERDRFTAALLAVLADRPRT